MRRLLVLVLVVGCGGSPSPNVPPPARSNLIVQASGGQSLAIAAPGGTLQLAAYAQVPSDGYGGGTTLAEVSASWSSTPAAVATVGSTGLVTGVAAGTAEITATASGATGKATVTVGSAPPPPPPPAAITIDWNLAATALTTTVAAGTPVQWRNTDASTTKHTVVADTAPPPDFVSLNGGTTSPAQTITAKGTYHYHCGIHSSMHGTLVVQ